MHSSGPTIDAGAQDRKVTFCQALMENAKDASIEFKRTERQEVDISPLGVPFQPEHGSTLRRLATNDVRA
jgi:hypothetical protein